MLGRGFYTLIKNVSFPSSIDVISHNPPPFEAQRPRQHSISSPINVKSHNPPPSEPSVLASTQSPLHSMWDLTIQPPSGPSVLTDTRSPLQSMWDLTIHALQGSTSSVAHHPMSDSYTICNSPSPSLANIVIFELSLKVFKTRLLGGSFYTLVNNVSFSSPTNVGSNNFKNYSSGSKD